MVLVRDRIAPVSIENYRNSAISCILTDGLKTRKPIDFVHVAIDSTNSNKHDAGVTLIRTIFTEKQEAIEIRLPVRYR